MRKIKLSMGRYAVVDDADYDEVSKYKWSAFHPRDNFWYARRKIQCDRKQTFIYLHRAIMGVKSGGPIVDHIDGNGLNNVRRNLRTVTHSQNMMNRRGPNVNSKSGIRGVCLKNGRWLVQISVGGKNLYLGVFKSVDDAKNARLDAVRKYYGNFSK